MKMMVRAFAKKLFGVKYERLTRTAVICLILFLGLHMAELQIRIRPCILYLMASTFTAGVMLQALSSGDNAAELRHMLMLPFERWEFAVSYTAVMGAYAFLTKTAVLLSAVFALSHQGRREIGGSILCAVGAILIAACGFLLKNDWMRGGRKAGVHWADGYSFCPEEGKSCSAVKSHRHCLMWHYFFRYLWSHKNYLTNTAVMWCVACALPLFFRETESRFALPVCFAILSLNTPVCILLSCDPALEQAVRFLPGGEKEVLVPYGLFIFLCNSMADSIFLCSFWFQRGVITGWMIAAALFFSLLSAFGSVLLEWFCPIRNWKIESDLWHHPRKYVIPAAMLLLAGAAGIFLG